MLCKSLIFKANHQHDAKACKIFKVKSSEVFDNMSKTKDEVLAEFRQIPGVGKTIALDFWNLGFRSINDLQNKDPEALYQQLCELQGCHVDRCMLYVMRCAVYHATEKNPQPHLLKWWNWKD
jgi:hypothetical protein